MYLVIDGLIYLPGLWPNQDLKPKRLKFTPWEPQRSHGLPEIESDDPYKHSRVKESFHVRYRIHHHAGDRLVVRHYIPLNRPHLRGVGSGRLMVNQLDSHINSAW